ncbi:MAG TPA: VCBS repeat-containing protein [Planctomycetaceae bacterium]|mgnify:CR=1 FL=1|nr:VCBS repeat-containing protein [Planctomycetaceae bacterium]HQZ66289.1 VCBS repeat-containing protein [Planctomycetaceae bacterium]
MRSPYLPCLLASAVVASLGSVELLPAGDGIEKSNELAQFYGFSGIELFKVEPRAFNLQAGDFTGDGLTDVMVIDNRGSCLRVLAQRSQPDQNAAKLGGKANDLSSDWRFDIRAISVDNSLAGMSVGDFNGDNRLDVACIGTPDQLIIRYQPAPGELEWTQKWTTRLPGIEPVAWMIAAGDINSDHRDDIVVLGKNVTYVIPQNERGEMDTPQPLINTSPQLSMVQVADLNGDGRNDICYLANEGTTRGLCARLQTNDSRLGPEMRFGLQQPRSVTLANVDQKPGHEVVTVESRTGRIQISSLQPAELKDGTIPSRLLQYGIGPSGANRDRGVAIGDVDGDKLTDVVVTDAEQAQLLLYRQNGIDGLGMAETFPSLLGVTDIAAADLEGNGVLDLVLLSGKEGVVAISHFENGRILFPETILKKPDGSELAAIDVLKTGEASEIIVALTSGSGSSTKLVFQRLLRSDAGEWLAAIDDEKIELIGAVGSRGVRLVKMDVNSDGRTDLLSVPTGTSKAGVQILLQKEDGSLEVAQEKSRLDLGVSSAGRTFVNKDRLLVARDSFARSLSFGANGWKVEDQFNAGESSANLEGVAALDLDQEPGDEIVLVDTGVHKLRIMRQQDGVYRPWKEVDLGAMQFSSTLVADFNGDGRSDLLLVGAQHFSVLYSGMSNSEMQELATFESEREKSYPTDVIVGDINGDGQVDLTVIDTSIDGVEILNFDAAAGLREATHFRVFEEKRLVSSDSDRGTEPREGLVADVTSDGRMDLILLCHDRLILYPQDSGEKAPQAAKTEAETE